MGGAPAPDPMGGASDVPPADPSMGGGAPMGGDPMGGGAPMGGDPMGGDPNAMGPDNGELDPNMGEPGMSEPMLNGEGDGEGEDSTVSIINQLSPEDREAVRAYAESMLSRDENSGQPEDGGEPMGGDPMGGGAPMGGDPNAGGPMMESRRGMRRINENLPVTDFYSRKEKNFNEKKKGNGLSKKSPFNSPKFK